MKKKISLLLNLFILSSTMLNAQTEFVKRDYLPGIKRLVSSKVNLVSVVKTDADRYKIKCTSVNTIAERPLSSKKDVWIQSVNENGTVIRSARFGKTNVSEEASCITRCPNGDIIVAAMTFIAPTPEYNGVTSFWLFRKGIINWSYRYYLPGSGHPTGNSGDTVYCRPYCIKKTNEAAENYLIAANNEHVENSVMKFSIPLVFKINAAGDLIWTRDYRETPGVILSGDVFQPKSMLINNDTAVIAGNYYFASHGTISNRKIFVMAINQVTGDMVHNGRSFAVDLGAAEDPFINFGYDNDYVMTYQTSSAIDDVVTGRVTFAKLDYNLNLNGDPVLLWETGTLNSYGHTIYKAKGTVQKYMIGGGTTVAGGLSGTVSNPLIITINKTGVPDPTMCQRFWTRSNYISTYMMEDSLINSPFRYVLHNYKQVNPAFSMSLIHAATKPVSLSCNQVVGINHRTVPALLGSRNAPLYALSSFTLTRESYGFISAGVSASVTNCE
jgi:hypothetical protein